MVNLLGNSMIRPLAERSIFGVFAILYLSLTSCAPIKIAETPLLQESVQDNSWREVIWDKECIKHLPKGEQLLPANTICFSEPIDLMPGHYEIRIVSSSSKESLRTLTILPNLISSGASGELRLTPVEAKRHEKGGYPSICSIRLFSGRSFENFNSESFKMFPPEYPYDGGWLPETPAGFKFEVRSSTELSFKTVEIRRSKFNLPLAARIPNSTSPVIPLSLNLKEIAVNLQGSSSDQLNELQDARKSWKPSGPILIISQIAPDDITPNGVSQGALQVLQELKSWSEESEEIRFGVSINPYLNDHHKGLQTRFFDSSAFEGIKRALLPFLAEEVDLVLLRTDDFTPSVGSTPYDYGLTHQKDRTTFKTLAKAHLALISQVQKLVHQESPNTHIAFVPPWYATSFVRNSPKLGSEYFQELSTHLAQSIPIVWTGPVVRSLWIDDTSVEEFKKLTMNHSLMLWDNTPYARAHKDFWLQDTERILSCSLLEPYDIPISDKFFSESGIPQVLVNTGVNPISRIQLETTQRYISDPSRYDPEKILWSILISRFGEEYARLLLDFDRNFWIAYKALKENYSVSFTLNKSKLTSILDEMGHFSSLEAGSTTKKLKILINSALKE